MSAGFCYSTLVNLEHSTICIDSGFGSLYQSPIPVFIQNSYNHFLPYEFS
jgi:hypothetical protein